MTYLSQILEHKIVAIIRGAQPGDVLKIADALCQGGIKVLEITFNSPDALIAIHELSRQMGKQLLIGAGTILDPASAKAVIEAGAKFIISPSLDADTIRVTKQMGVVSIPGAFTATEILTAYRHGGDIIKVFPASVGSNYIRDLRGPFPHIPLMPTGGITLENIGDYMRAGAVVAGVGSALVNTREKIDEGYIGRLTNKALQFVKAITNLN